MAIDLAEHNILVNCVSPGFVDTELTRKVLGEEQMKIMAEKIPMKRLASVKDITPTILFLCSEFNTYITGQNITVDGGFTLE
jgi:3-oxoacyl-[acyl-carrier protein] reductase